MRGPAAPRASYALGVSKRAWTLLSLVILLGLIPLGCALFFGPSAEELETIRGTLAQEERLVIDVRSPEEYAEGHLQGAINIPHGEIGERLDEVGPSERDVIVYCASGVRSSWAASTLRDAGYTHVHDLGGIGNGAEVGLETVPGSASGTE